LHFSRSGKQRNPTAPVKELDKSRLNGYTPCVGFTDDMRTGDYPAVFGYVPMGELPAYIKMALGKECRYPVLAGFS